MSSRGKFSLAIGSLVLLGFGIWSLVNNINFLMAFSNTQAYWVQVGVIGGEILGGLLGLIEAISGRMKFLVVILGLALFALQVIEWTFSTMEIQNVGFPNAYGDWMGFGLMIARSLGILFYVYGGISVSRK